MDDQLFHGLSISMMLGMAAGIGRLLFVLGRFSQRFVAVEEGFKRHDKQLQKLPHYSGD